MRAEAELRAWREANQLEIDLALAVVDVLAERALARGLTAELGVRHDSPQALWFAGGELRAHDSHGALTGAWYDA